MVSSVFPTSATIMLGMQTGPAIETKGMESGIVMRASAGHLSDCQKAVVLVSKEIEGAYDFEGVLGNEERKISASRSLLTE